MYYYYYLLFIIIILLLLLLLSPTGDYLGLVTPPGTPSKRSSTHPVPTDSQLSHPIRRYISETLICHVLGQPSYTLSCLLVSAVSQYLEAPLQFDKPITIEEVCKKVCAILECV